MNRLVVLAFLVACAAAAAQQATRETFVPAADRSPSGSPIAVSGTFIVKDNPAELFQHSGEGEISLTNVSSKPILLTVLRLHMVGVRAADVDSRSDDFFFSEMLQAGASETVEDSWRFGTTESDVDQISGGKGTPKANVSMFFVQYADGSTWGASAAAKVALDSRDNTVKRLMALESVYRQDGEKAFIDDLLKPSSLPTISVLQDFCKRTEDKTRMIDRFFRVLEASDNHARMLRSVGRKP